MINTISIIILAVLISTAAATPLQRSAAQFSCSPVDTQGATLALNPGGYTAGIQPGYNLANAIAATGDTVHVAINPPVVVTSFLFTGPNTAFGFEACASTFLGYPANEIVGGLSRWYGHLIAPGYLNHCVTRRYVDTGHEFLTIEPCSTVDDATQELQYFRLIETFEGNDEDPYTTFTLNNVAHPSGTQGKIYYYAPGTVASAPAWTVHPDQVTGFNLFLAVVPHGN